MPIARARRLCPNGVYLPVRMSRYAEVSARVFAIYERFTPLVEPLSIDEAFLDVTGCGRLSGPPRRRPANQETVRAETGLIVSAGAASNKFIAKIASDMGKPDGLVVVPPGRSRRSSTRFRSGRYGGWGRSPKGSSPGWGSAPSGTSAARPGSC